MNERTDPKSQWSMGQLAATMFVQMLPATLLIPAIRPLFAQMHDGNEGAMHAFMAVNMAGAAVAVPIVAKIAGKLAKPHRLLALLAALDALLLVAITMPLPVAVILLLRTLEGAAHVGAATLLLAEAASRARTSTTGRTMGTAGCAIISAVVLGSALGGFIVEADVRAPYWVGAGLAIAVACVAMMNETAARAKREPRRKLTIGIWRTHRMLAVPITAAFVARFTIGCIVVTFALFAHYEHGLSDRAVGGLFALLTFPFALSMYPAGRATDRFPCAAILGGGIVIYLGALIALGRVSTGGLPVVMLCAGIASGLIFAGVLHYASRLAGPDNRYQAMALVNVAGCLGMLLGPMAAGIASAIGNSAGDPVAGYRAAFLIAAGAIALWLVVWSRWLVHRWSEERAGIRSAGARDAAAIVARSE